MRRQCFQMILNLSFLMLVIFFPTDFIANEIPSFADERECVTLQPIVCIEEQECTTLQPTIQARPIIISKQPLEENESIVTEIEGEMVWLSDEEINLIALVTMAEAEGECEEGKRLVIDTILNRVDSEHFPDTVYDVIYQPNQFSSMWNGRVDRCEVRDDICQLVREELKVRANYEVVFFTAGNYGKYGTPMFQVQNHYFSSYE